MQDAYTHYYQDSSSDASVSVGTEPQGSAIQTQICISWRCWLNLAGSRPLGPVLTPPNDLNFMQDAYTHYYQDSSSDASVSVSTEPQGSAIQTQICILWRCWLNLAGSRPLGPVLTPPNDLNFMQDAYTHYYQDSSSDASVSARTEPQGSAIQIQICVLCWVG